MQQYSPIQLYPTQVDPVARMINILRVHPVAVNTSDTGAGKTAMSIYIMNIFNKLTPLVVCPANVISTWHENIQNHVSRDVNIVSYDMFKSGEATATSVAKGRSLYFSTTAYPPTLQTRSRKKPSLSLSKYSEKIIREGVLLVLDEYHTCKNIASANYKACSLFIEEIYNNYQRMYEDVNSNFLSASRVLLLSATPGNKVQDVRSLISTSMCAGMRLSSSGLTPDLATKIIDNMIVVCSGIDHALAHAGGKVTEQYVTGNRRPDNIAAIGEAVIQALSKKKISSNEALYYAYTCIAVPVLISYSPPIRTIEGTTMWNRFYLEGDKLKRNIIASRSSKLEDDFKNLKDPNITANRSMFLENIARGLTNLEIAKADLFVSRADAYLKSKDHNYKIVIFVNNLETVDIIERGLASKGHNVGVITGSKKKEDRPAIVSLFQQPNNRLRVIVSTIKVTSVGISLDDRFGNWPRIALISPSYSIVNIVQATGRVLRITTRSTPAIRFVYANTDAEGKIPINYDQYSEIRVIDRLSRSSSIMLGYRGHMGNIRLPSSYDAYIEYYGDNGDLQVKEIDYNALGITAVSIELPPNKSDSIGSYIERTVVAIRLDDIIGEAMRSQKKKGKVAEEKKSKSKGKVAEEKKSLEEQVLEEDVIDLLSQLSSIGTSK